MTLRPGFRSGLTLGHTVPATILCPGRTGTSPRVGGRQRIGLAAFIGLPMLVGVFAPWPAGLTEAQQPGSPPPPRRAPAVQVDLHVIGFDVSANVEGQLRDMATAGGGTYHRSGSEADLTRSLGQAVGVTPPSAAVPADAAMSRESEPNDRLGLANPIAPAGEIAGAIRARGDVDWYRVTVPRQGALAFSTRGVPSNIDLVLRAWDAGGRAISGWFNPPGPGGETAGVIDLPRPGSYWIEAHDGRDDAGSAELYRIAFEFTPTADTAEPNDTLASAQPLAIGATVTSNILPRADADWYRVTAPRQGALVFTITEVPAALDIEVRVWNANGQPVTGVVSPPRAGADTTGLVDLPAAGDYWLEVRDGRDDARSERPYRLTVRFTPTVDPGEPNDSLTTAQPLALDARIQANILPRGDVDWFRIETPRQGTLGLHITGVADTLDLVARGWNARRQPFTAWLTPPRKGADTVAMIDLPEPGTYWFEIHDGNEDARSEQPYTLALSFTPTPDEGEPNGTIAEATSLAFGVPLHASILPQGDVDVYRVETGGAGALDVDITNQADNLDVVARVWSADRKPISPWLLPPRRGADTVAKVALKEAGVYFLEVSDGNNDARSEKPYRLLLKFSGLVPPTTGPAQPAGAGAGATPSPASTPTPTAAKREEVGAVPSEAQSQPPGTAGVPAPPRLPTADGPDELVSRLREAVAAEAPSRPAPEATPTLDPATPPSSTGAGALEPVPPGSADADLLEALRKSLSDPAEPK